MTKVSSSEELVSSPARLFSPYSRMLAIVPPKLPLRGRRMLPICSVSVVLEPVAPRGLADGLTIPPLPKLPLLDLL